MAVNKDYKKLLGKKLKLIRITYGKLHPEYKRQTTFAEEILGIKQDMLSKYEKGKIFIPLSIILKLKKLHVNLDWFFDIAATNNIGDIFRNVDNYRKVFSYMDFIRDKTLRNINNLLLKMSDEDRRWLIGYLEGRDSKSEDT